MSEFAARLVAYEPDGDRIGPMPFPTQWSASLPHNDDGALTLTYSSLEARGELIERGLLTGLEIALEVAKHDGTWTEPDGARFMLIKRDQDNADQTRSKTLTLPAYSWELGKARNNDTSSLYPPGHAQAGKRGFEAASAGGVLAQLLAENAARGGLRMTTNATAALDSAGVVWAQVANRAYALGAPLNAIREDLVTIGLCDWRTRGRQLRLYNPDTVHGVDRSTSVRLWLGVDVGEAPSSETLEGLIHKVLVQTDGGATTTVEAVGVPTPWGEWEGFLPIGSVDTEADAIVAGQADVDRNAKVGAQYTRSLTLPGAKHWPMVDYQPGDWITAPTSGTGEKVRIQQVTLSGGAVGITGALVLNDRLMEAELRRAKALAAVTGGASSVSSTGGVTPSDSYAGRTPRAPSALLLDTDVYVDAGVNRARVVANWVGPTQGVDGQPITAATYGVQWRYGTTGPWSAVLPSTDDQLTIPGLDLGNEVQVQVQAVTASGIAGPFSSPATITTASDTTAPPVPSLPGVGGSMTVISITWDGTLTGAIPGDFARVEFAVGPTATPTEIRGTLTRTGTAYVAGESVGETRYVRARSVDTSDNPSAWTTAVPVVVQSVVAGEIDAAIIQDIIDAQTTADTALTSANGKSKVNYGASAPTAATPGRPGDIFWVRSGATIIGQYLCTAGTGGTSGNTWAAQTLTNATIATLDAGKITTGFLAGARIEAGTITADKVLISSSGSLFPWNPQGNGTAPHVTSSGATMGAIYDADMGWCIQVTGGTGTDGTLAACFNIRSSGIGPDGVTGHYPVDAGKSYRVLVGFGSGGTTPAGVSRQAQFVVNFYDKAGALIAGTPISPTVTPSFTEPVYTSLIVTAPATAATAMVYLRKNFWSTGDLFVVNPTIVPAADASLVVDGTITAIKLAADSVTAGAIAAGAIDGKVITGATIRTASGANRLELSGTSFKGYVGGNLGLQLDPNGLSAYDSTGALKFRLSAYTTSGEMTYVDFLQADNIKTAGTEFYTTSDETGLGAQIGFVNYDPFTNALAMISNDRNILLRTTSNEVRLWGSTVVLRGNDSLSFLGGTTERLNISSAGSIGLNNLLTTTTSAATLGLAAVSGTTYPLRRITSSLKYKRDIEPYAIDLGALLSLHPSSWRDKAEVQDDPATTRRHVGLIAEEVHAAGLTEFVQYAEDGTPDGFNYDRFAAVALLAAITDLYPRVAALENA